MWAKSDISQQEFRFIVHYAVAQGLRKAEEAAERYRTDPDTDFHQLVSDWTGLDRQSAKNTNFAKALRRWCAQVCGDDRQAGKRGARYL